eukprot:scaffold206_cov400-Prasinococcus_capsulatus_cf.AAC.6
MEGLSRALGARPQPPVVAIATERGRAGARDASAGGVKCTTARRAQVLELCEYMHRRRQRAARLMLPEEAREPREAQPPPRRERHPRSRAPLWRYQCCSRESMYCRRRAVVRRVTCCARRGALARRADHGARLHDVGVTCASGTTEKHPPNLPAARAGSSVAIGPFGDRIGTVVK